MLNVVVLKSRPSAAVLSIIHFYFSSADINRNLLMLRNLTHFTIVINLTHFWAAGLIVVHF
jgi:hypothetical protein